MANGRTRAPNGGLVLDQCFNDGVRDARREGVNKTPAQRAGIPKEGGGTGQF